MGYKANYHGTYPSQWSEWDWNFEHQRYVRYRLVGKGNDDISSPHRHISNGLTWSQMTMSGMSTKTSRTQNQNLPRNILTQQDIQNNTQILWPHQSTHVPPSPHPTSTAPPLNQTVTPAIIHLTPAPKDSKTYLTAPKTGPRTPSSHSDSLLPRTRRNITISRNKPSHGLV